MATRRRSVTLEAVAERAGVSLKTASNAVNGTGRMADATRERVLAVVAEMEYKVNVAARNLTLGRTGAVTLALPTLKAAYLAELAEGVMVAARELDLVVYVTTVPDDATHGSRDYLRRFNVHQSDGLLFSMAEQEQLGPEDFEVDYPLVCLGSRSVFGVVDRVSTDDVADARAAAAYLYDRGSTSIGIVGARVPFDAATIATETQGNAEQRMRGVLEASLAVGRSIDPRLVGVTGYDWGIGKGFRATREIIASGVPFDGLVCLNDGLAVGAISALLEHGLRVPDDVQVIGFDNIEESAFLTPSLTTMDSRIEWIARTALERLVARIDGEQGRPTDLVARSRLLTRGTTR
ncbi:LacI family DNA-binding transcriptional regulator [Agromyces sp. NPDC058104]|uniref:LacI family DNA-binding transcriptional regulator n=1 Tax=Agromyces sp. NPDC058104 TaxID=3346342 RepID=UPI0036DC9B0C